MPYIRGRKRFLSLSQPLDIMTARDLPGNFDIEVHFNDELFPEVYPASENGIIFLLIVLL